MSQIWVVLVIVFIISSLIRKSQPKKGAPTDGASPSGRASGVPAGQKLNSAGAPNLSAAGDAVKVSPAPKKRPAKTVLPPRETYVPAVSREGYAAADGSLGEGEGLWQEETAARRETAEPGASREVPGLSLNLDGDDLVRAVIYSEILRRRPGLEVRKAR